MFIIYFLIPIVLFLLFEILSKKWDFSLSDLFSLKNLLIFIGAILFNYAVFTVCFLDFTAILKFNLLGLFVVACSSLFFETAHLLIKSLKKSNSIIAFLLLSVCIALFLEGFVFNMRFYQTYYYEKYEITEKIELPYNLIPVENSKNKYKISNNSRVNFEFENLNRKINNIYFDISAEDDYANNEMVSVSVYITDESNELYLTLPSQDINGDVESSKYLYLLTNGETEKLKIAFSSEGANITLNEISINRPRDFSFNLFRFFLCAFVIFIAWLLRPSSPIYRKKMTFSARQTNFTAIVIALEVALLIVISLFNPVFENIPSAHHAQYQQLADAFLDGRLYLEQEPPQYLADMDNPYDYYARAQQASINGESYYWDAAYFDGHYYVYFGALPVLLFYLPFKAITGMDLTNRTVIQICLTLFVIGAFTLIEKIIKKYFDPKRIPYVSFLALCLIFVNASGAVFIAKRPDFYSIPIISALTLTMFGLYFWLSSTDIEGIVKPIPAALGSLCMALVAGCRPQFLLVSLTAIVIFWGSVFKDRSLFSKKSIGTTISICLPYIIVAAILMWYNYARFGSPFDFGQNYNLTTNDMTGRGIRFERVGLAFFTYFLQLPNITATFPFVKAVTINTGYLGTTITEAMFGGIFATIPLLWILFLVPSISKELRKKRILPFIVLFSALSVFIGLFDAQGAGILQRYMSDFAYLSCLAAIFVILFLYERSRGARTRQLNAFTSFSLFANGIYCFLIIFAIYGTEIYYYNPSLFANAASLIQFWR